MSLKLEHAAVTVTTAGTRVRLSTTPIYCDAIYVEALGTNTGNIFVGDVTVSSTVYAARLGAGVGFSMNAPKGDRKSKLDISSLYFDSSVNGEKIQVTYLKQQDNT